MNTFGYVFRATTWGESHGPAVGAVIDGCPAGLPLCEEDIERELARDVPDPDLGTPRREGNSPKILSGVFEGRTIGTPISIVIYNDDARSRDYTKVRETFRPGHGDYTYWEKYRHVDWRGGGRASGRECIARLAAGAVAKKLIARAVPGCSIISRVVELAGIPIETPEDYRRAKAKALAIRAAGDSTGGVVEVRARGVPAGLGSPVFHKLDGLMAGALMGIGGVKSVEIGAGINAARETGSRNNDFYRLREGKAIAETNNAGGILAGISNGQKIVARIAVKPTPTVGIPQRTVTTDLKREVEAAYSGRHDGNFAPRVAPIAEAMVALVLADSLIRAGFIHPDFLDKHLPERVWDTPAEDEEGFACSQNTAFSSYLWD